MRSSTSISEEAYEDLFKLKEVIENPGKTLIIARHGLEWWVAWILKTDVAQEHTISEKTWNNYYNIYYIKQIKGQSDFGVFGPGSTPFPEPNIPEDAKIAYKDEYFKLFLVEEPPEGYFGPP